MTILDEPPVEERSHEAPPVTVKREPLTYERHGRHSYFRDLILRDKDTRSEERLRRHAEEMRVIGKERNERAWERLRAGNFEYRVDPNTTPGTGGYFAPPLWLNQFYVTADRPKRVLADLIPKYDLPLGCSSVNLPIIGTGNSAAPVPDGSGLPDTDVTDSAGSSTVVTIAGKADTALQLLEQSPAGAHLDAAFFQDLTEAYDADLELQLLTGTGVGQTLLGVTNVNGINSISYTGAATGSAMYPYFGRAAAQIGENRDVEPECWLMRTARWAWLMSSEDTATLPFGLYTQFYLGNDDDTPDPRGGLLGWPVFLSDAIPTNLGTTANQDVVICLRPRDLLLLEGQPQVTTARESQSGSLGITLSFHNRVAAITNRRPAGVSVLTGSGMAVVSGF